MLIRASAATELEALAARKKDLAPQRNAAHAGVRDGLLSLFGVPCVSCARCGAPAITGGGERGRHPVAGAGGPGTSVRLCDWTRRQCSVRRCAALGCGLDTTLARVG